MTEQERYEEYIQTPEYIARQEALTEWLEEQEQERSHLFLLLTNSSRLLK